MSTKLHQFGPIVAQVSIAGSGREFPGHVPSNRSRIVARVRSHVAWFRPSSARFRPNFTPIRPTFAEVGPCLAQFDQIWGCADRFRSKFGQFCLHSKKVGGFDGGGLGSRLDAGSLHASGEPRGCRIAPGLSTISRCCRAVGERSSIGQTLGAHTRGWHTEHFACSPGGTSPAGLSSPQFCASYGQKTVLPDLRATGPGALYRPRPQKTRYSTGACTRCAHSLLAEVPLEG